MPHVYAQIDAASICVAITQSDTELCAEELLLLPAFDTAVLGKRWTGTHWEDVTRPQITQPRHITKRAFRARFTKAERVAIEWAAVDRADASQQERQLAAALRADLKDQELASYIDLDATDVIEGLQQLAAFALIEPHRPAEILTAPVQDAERLST